jgi:glutamyl-tRNA reductase
MNLLLLGVSHHTAPVDLRERVDFSKRGVVTALRELALRPSPAEAVVLTTCNRSEIYVACQEPEAARDDLTGFMSGFHEVPEDQLAPHLYARTDGEVAQHLFRVAAGLDSLVVGEPQIFGQVKDAYATAASEQCTGTLLNKLFPWSFTIGKRVRADTGLGEGAVSVGYAAISLARKIFGDLDGLSVLVAGAGEMAELTATHLRSQRVRRIAVASRTLARASELAGKVEGVAVDWSAVDDELLRVDVVVTATGAATPILTRARLEEVMHARRNRPLFVIDIGLPRDVDPRCGELEQVFLYNIDDLQAIVRENQARRQAQVDRAELLVEEEVDGFMRWLRSRGSVPTVVALRRRFEEIRRAELVRLAPKLASMPPDARARVEEVTRLLVERLLSTPTERLKAAPDEDAAATDADTLSRLFELGLGEDSDDDTPALREARLGSMASPSAARNR